MFYNKRIILKISIIFFLFININCKTNYFMDKQSNIENVTKRHYKEGNFLEMNREDKLIEHNTWNLKTVEGIKFYFDLSIPKREREIIIENVTNGINNDSLKLDTNSPIIFWVFSSQDQKQKLTKNEDSVHIVKEYNSIYTYYRQLLIEQTFSIPNS